MTTINLSDVRSFKEPFSDCPKADGAIEQRAAMARLTEIKSLFFIIYIFGKNNCIEIQN
jgi:hypothetical protein